MMILPVLAGLGLVALLVSQASAKPSSPSPSKRRGPTSLDEASPSLMTYAYQFPREFEAFRSMIADPLTYSLGDFYLVVDHLSNLGFYSEADTLADLAMRVADIAPTAMMDKRFATFLSPVPLVFVNGIQTQFLSRARDNGFYTGTPGPTSQGIPRDTAPFQHAQQFVDTRQAAIDAAGKGYQAELEAATKAAKEG